MTLIGFVMLYMLLTIAIGIYAAMRVNNTNDYALAGRSLPLPMVVTATFATWFGSETILGLPGRFIESGIHGVVEDPFGSGMALVLVGMFFAQKLYKLNILTIGDYYRHRYGRGIEVLCTIFIVISYLGWVGAQVAALGLVINLITEGMISVSTGMMIGTGVVLVYTMFGGMWSVAITDFFQMIIIVAGLIVILFFAADLAGGFDQIIGYARQKELFHALPEPTVSGWLFWISAAITMMIGSIPQQDVFQRVMSAKDTKTAMAGPIIGGCVYILFAFVPMFIVIAAILVMPDTASGLLQEDPQRVLPTLVKDYMPMWLRVLFFGAVLSAVMSTASATILAPSTAFVSNILTTFVKLDDRHMLRAMRWTVFVFTFLVLTYSLLVEGTAIYDMVAMAYQFPVVGAFWPLVCGLYWKHTTRQGVYLSMFLGGVVWSILTWSSLGDVFPNVLGGFIAAGFGMVVGSLLPTRGNREYLREWNEKNRNNVVNEALLPKSTKLPASTPA
ncbi:MAG: sodium:solute symporter family protein [Sutterella sp.]|nr:sodium:solute symporter family protein [Sutterella sp.]